MATLADLKKEALDEMYKLGLYRSRNASEVYAFVDGFIDRAVDIVELAVVPEEEALNVSDPLA